MNIRRRPAGQPLVGALAGGIATVLAIAAALVIGSATAPEPGTAAGSRPPATAPAASATAEAERGSTPAPTAPATPRETASPEPVRDATPGPVLEEELEAEAEDLVEDTVIPPDLDAAPDADDLERVLADVAAGAYRAELEAQWLELAANGWTYTGESRVDGLEILSLDETADPATAEISVCIDSSAVVLVDAAGEPVGAGTDTAARAVHLFSLVRVDGAWLVAARTFPDDPAC